MENKKQSKRISNGEKGIKNLALIPILTLYSIISMRNLEHENIKFSLFDKRNKK